MGAARKKPNVPSYRLHASSGLAVVTLTDPATGKARDYYLGKYDTEESHREYDRVIGQWLLTSRWPAGPQLHTPAGPSPAATAGLTVKQVFDAYMAYAAGPTSPYRKRGGFTGYVSILRMVQSGVVALCGATLADAFGVPEIKRLRDWLLAEVPRQRGGQGWSEAVVRKALTIVKGIFAWAAEEGLVNAAAAGALLAVKVRRMTAMPKRGTRVRPVLLSVVEATVAHAPPHLAGMIRTQHLAAMRPCEVIGLTPGDLDRDGRVPDGPRFDGVWVYSVSDDFNKNAHKGQSRIVFLGPRAQAVLAPRLDRPATWAVFSSAEAAHSQARPGGHYKTPSYGVAIDSAVDQARRALPGEDLPYWNPNQLRHLRATEIRALYPEVGAEAAQVVLGHATPGVTGRYAEPDLRLAARVMREIG